MDDNLFDIAHQWNQAKGRLNTEEKEELIEINYKAGVRAKDTAAYQDAALFFRHGAELIADSLWTENYSFAFDYYREYSEAEYLARNFEKAEKLFGHILERVENIVDKSGIYAIMMRHYITQLQSKKALELSIEILRELGVKLPHNPGTGSLIFEFVKAKLLMGKKEPACFHDLPEAQNEKVKAAMEILILMVTPALTINPLYAPIAIIKVLVLTLKHGVARMSPAGVTGYGAILAATLSDISKGVEFSESAVEMSQRPLHSGTRSVVLFSYVSTLLHLKSPFQECSRQMNESKEVCLGDGNFEYYGYLHLDSLATRFLSGAGLDEMMELLPDARKKIFQLKQPQSEIQFSILNQFFENLAGLTEDKLVMSGKHFNEDQLVQIREDKNMMSDFYLHIFKSILSYLFDDHENGLQYAADAEKNADSMMGSFIVIVYHFYFALLIAVNLNAGAKEAKKYQSKVKAIEKKFKKWSEACPENYLNKYLLIQAEMSRFHKKPLEVTVSLYLDSLKAATENNLTLEVALTNERIAHYYISKDQTELAKTYMTKSCSDYEKWGLTAKVELLKE